MRSIINARSCSMIYCHRRIVCHFIHTWCPAAGARSSSPSSSSSASLYAGAVVASGFLGRGPVQPSWCGDFDLSGLLTACVTSPSA